MLPFLFIAVVVLWLVAFLLLRLKRYKWQWVKTAVMALAFFFAGVFTTMFRLSPRFSSEQRAVLSDSRGFVVRVVDHPVPRARSVKVVAELWQSDRGAPLRGKALLYVQCAAPQAAPIRYGDVLAVATSLSDFDPPANPDAFGTRRYMQRKGIFLTGFVPANGWQRLGHRAPNALKSLSHNMQQQLAARYATAGMSGSELAIARAILLGDDDTMEPELRASYAAAGVSHILCVSGMHVGVIFMILSFLLKPLDLFPTTRLLKALLLMLAIWLYAHITGLSPSVTRSATMFTFVTVGGVLRRNTNVFHSLMASLFVLLALRPQLLFEVGFQLSYLAVFGIVLLQPRIAGIYNCKTKIADYFWQLLSVSVAAQIATFPISTYYFGIFPNYFLISNLTVIALSFVVIITGVAVLAVSWVPIMSGALSFLLTWEIRIMNGIVSFVEGLPGAVTRDIDFSGGQVLLLYLCIIMLYCMINYRRRWFFWALLSGLVLLSGTFALRRVQIVQRDEVVVYHIRNVSALSFCRGAECIFFSDS
ncbi:MAG: ComEC family competence protein, partial [Bacteroidales bacterium]|nr:ComEC family competence protein [Bacteroidales bacterium]